MRLPSCLMNLCCWCLLLAGSLQAQTEAGFDKSSLAWRTALHFDPGAEAPLRSLIRLYQEAGKLSDLISLYTQHLAQFPQDEGATVVLARLYAETRDQRAETFLSTSIQSHPQNALLLYTKARWLESKFDVRALETLDAAIALEKTPARRAQWLGDLIKAAATAGQQALITQRLRAMAEEKAFTPAQRLPWARRCLEIGFPQSAAAVLADADFTSLQGDEAVEALFVQARVALANQKTQAASAHAKAALNLLAADHWRHLEAVTLRWQTATEAERKQILSDAEKAWKTSITTDTAALAYGDLLVTAGRREEALKIWREALLRTPQSRLIEDRLLDLYESQRQDDAQLAFLADRVKQQPEREDLRLRRARLLLQLGRMEEGTRALDELLSQSAPDQRATTLLQTARWLRSRNLFTEAAQVLEGMIKADPQRWDVRKELAEVYVLLKRQPDMQRLFETVMPDTVTAEVRLEVAQFLIAQKLWTEAKRVLEGWVQSRPSEFDARLLLAKIEALSGDDAAAAKHLQECRDLSDTEARYAAWLAAAWEQASELEDTTAFLESERARLWPKGNETWDAARLSRLSALAQQTTQSKVQADAEKLLRTALESTALPAAGKRELRHQLIAVLDGQKDRSKALETEIQQALKDGDDAAMGDLRMRLALMYLAAQRLDLARQELRQIVAAQCQDTALLQRAIASCKQLNMSAEATAMAERLVRLQPDEQAHWVSWTTLLMESGDESQLRSALREMRARAVAWKLSDQAQETIRRHLAASCWRSITRALADPEHGRDDALLWLSELDQTELDPKRRLWTAWVRGTLALQEGDEVSLAEARAALQTQEPWLDFPDGLSLSMTEAQRLLEMPKQPVNIQPLKPRGANDSTPSALSWVFKPSGRAFLQRWCLTPSGSSLLAQDSAGQIYHLDRVTGRLLWQRKLSAGQPIIATRHPWRGGGEQVSYPSEWCVSDARVCLLNEESLTCRRLDDAKIVWQVKTESVVAGAQGCLAFHQGKVLWWRVALGRLDALDETSGKLLWTQRIPPLSESPPPNANNPMWMTSGIRVDQQRVLVWGNGTAVLRFEDGAILWKVSAADAQITFPMELGDAPANSQAPLIISSTTFGSRRAFTSSGGFNRYRPVNTLAMPSYGYPGMYGSAQTSPWLLWGGDGERWLQGDGIWLLGQNILTARYSLLGLPVTSPALRNSHSIHSGQPIGTVGRALIVASETGVTKVLPDGQTRRLFASDYQDSRPAKHPLPAVALDGHILSIATRDRLQRVDAVSGTVLWDSPWPEAAAPFIQQAEEDLNTWQSLRWSSRGVSFYDGQGRTLTVEWQALMAGKNLIVPVGTHSLMCLGKGQE